MIIFPNYRLYRARYLFLPHLYRVNLVILKVSVALYLLVSARVVVISQVVQIEDTRISRCDFSLD